MVVGGGVIGLTTAITLAEDGWEVAVLTAEPVAATTSAVAAAVWFPYLVGPADAVARWGRETADELAMLADDPAVPVAARTLHELLRHPDQAPAWRTDMPDFAPVARHDLPEWTAAGWRYTSWVADMPPYLTWLQQRLAEHGVVPEVHRVTDLAAAADADTDLVVDCAGVEAARLAEDPQLEPVRGQVVLVDAPAVTDVWLDPEGPGGATYVIPRGETVVCGGTADRGAWDRTPDAEVTADILRRATALVPALDGAPVVEVAVGLRPSRPEVRLEVEDTPAGPVLHHYGHGGAGVTLSWGSARAAARLARTVVE